MLIKTSYEKHNFWDLLLSSPRKAKNGRAVADLYVSYIKEMQELECPFNIEQYANDLGLEIETVPLPINIASKIEGTKITINSKDVYSRQRKGIAFQVAHYILEHGDNIQYRGQPNEFNET